MLRLYITNIFLNAIYKSLNKKTITTNVCYEYVTYIWILLNIQ